MTVDRASVDAMANIMRMLNADSSMAPEHANLVTEPRDSHDHNLFPGLNSINADFDPSLVESQAPAISRAIVSDPSIDAMKNILLAMQSVSTSPVERLAEAAEADPELKAALVTERTERGARIGSWEIIVNEGKNLSTYDVVSDDGHTVIARDLYVYDAAYGIAKRLNEGVAINDKKIRDLLKLEEEYAKNRNDAAVLKHTAKKLREKGDDFRAAVAEDRLDEAQRQALEAHERMLKLAGLR